MKQQRKLRAVVGGVLLVTLLGGARLAGEQTPRPKVTASTAKPATVKYNGTLDVATTDADRCDFLDPKRCLLPFPSDFSTVADATTDTGRRVNFAAASMPADRNGEHIDPSEWNRNDGFSPGTPILTFVAGLDLDRTGAAPITDMARSLARSAPIVLLDTTTGRRLPYWAEMDSSAKTADDRELVIRPAVALPEGHRVVVALRRLRDSTGTRIAPGAAFRAYRDRLKTTDAAVEARRLQMERIFGSLSKAGVQRADLFLAWDFTVASERNLSERMLHIRDDALGRLGAGNAPSFTVAKVEDDPEDHIARRVTGAFQVPSYLTGDGGPGSRFDNGPDGLPQRSGKNIDAPFICVIPHAAL